MITYLDFETRSGLDLKKVGTIRYTQNCEILCMAYAHDDGPIQLWTPGRPFPDLKPPFSAHNYIFEYLVLKNVLGIKTTLEDWLCSMALANSVGLAAGLGPLGEFLGMPKDSKTAMLKLSKPRKKKPLTWWTYDDCPDTYEELYRYCKQDVAVARKVVQTFGGRSRQWAMLPRERLIWAATERINHRGLLVDVPLLSVAQRELDREYEQLNAELQGLVGVNVNQTVALAKALGITSVAKDSVRDTLKDPTLSPIIRRALEIRQDIGRASVKKIAPLQDFHDPEDQRIKFTLVYAGAQKTARWSGRGFQPQNLPRGDEGEDSPTIDALTAGQPLARPHEQISNNLRRFLKGPFFVGDYSQIEARMLAWLAGNERLLNAFRNGVDPYKLEAANIYGKPIEDVTKDERFMGKQCFASNTKVLTKRGWIPIVIVRADDELWDGYEWVSHDGVVCNGVQKTIPFRSIFCTPDHLFAADCHEVVWKTDSPDEMRREHANSGLIWWKTAEELQGDYGWQKKAVRLGWRLTEYQGLPSGKIGDMRYPLNTCEELPVYDIVNAGPRHRYFVLSDRGPLMVHNCVLGLGYGCGPKGFVNMLDKTYDVQLDIFEAEELVCKYRYGNPEVVKYWRRIENAFRHTLTTGRTATVGRIKIEKKPSHVRIILPNGKPIYYHRAHIVTEEIVDYSESTGFYGTACFKERYSIRFWGRLKQANKWGWVTTYGGKLAENVTQASAREVIADAVVELDRQNYPLCLLVHDEVVSEMVDWATLDNFVHIMKTSSPWAEGLPIDVDAHIMQRYHK